MRKTGWIYGFLLQIFAMVLMLANLHYLIVIFLIKQILQTGSTSGGSGGGHGGSGGRGLGSNKVGVAYDSFHSPAQFGGPGGYGQQFGKNHFSAFIYELHVC